MAAALGRDLNDERDPRVREARLKWCNARSEMLVTVGRAQDVGMFDSDYGFFALGDARALRALHCWIGMGTDAETVVHALEIATAEMVGARHILTAAIAWQGKKSGAAKWDPPAHIGTPRA